MTVAAVDREIPTGKPRGLGTVVDVAELHAYLWRKSVAGVVEAKNIDLARWLGVSPSATSRAFRVMREEGRITKVKVKVGNIGVYQIADPAEWKQDDEGTWVRKTNVPRGRPVWG